MVVDGRFRYSHLIRDLRHVPPGSQQCYHFAGIERLSLLLPFGSALLLIGSGPGLFDFGLCLFKLKLYPPTCVS